MQKQLSNTWFGATIILYLIAGYVMNFAFDPYAIKFVALISIVIFGVLLVQDRSPLNIYCGVFAYNLGFWGGGISWINYSVSNFGVANPVVAVLITSFLVVFISLFATIVQGGILHFHKRFSARVFYWIAIPLAVTLFELIRSNDYVGFPWMLLGYVAVESSFANLLSIGGSLFAGLVLVYLALMLGKIALIELEGDKYIFSFKFRRFLLFTGCMVSVYLLVVALEKPKVIVDKGLQVSLYQIGITPDLAWRSEAKYIVSKRLDKLNKQLNSVDLVVWPESIFSFIYTGRDSYINKQKDFYAAQGTNLLAGLFLSDETGHTNNSAYQFSNGEVTARYDKQILVPFGEFIPLFGLLQPLVTYLGIPMPTLVPGSFNDKFSLEDYVYSVLICYEIAFPFYLHEKQKDSNFLVNISNDSWFGATQGPDQHLQIAKVRAKEYGKWVLRATTNGYTAFINPQGEVTAQAERFIATQITSEIDPSPSVSPTYFSDWGFTLYFLFLTLMLFIVLITWIINRYYRRSASVEAVQVPMYTKREH